MYSIRIYSSNKLSLVIHWSPPHIPPNLPSRAVPKNSPTIPTNIIHACHVGFHVDFASIENIIGYGP